ncbi:MAG: hypothetical protein K9G59_08315 [Caulobacter sp.]|nr:hypothetical protein [Caulobacter sp.]
MNLTITRLKLFFLVLFAVGTVGIWAYQIFYVWPAQKCDDRGAWWDRKGRVCATPLYIPSLTGRPVGMSRKEWSEKQAARQVQRDREGYPTGETAPESAAKVAAPVAKAASVAGAAASATATPEKK